MSQLSAAQSSAPAVGEMEGREAGEGRGDTGETGRERGERGGEH